VAGLGCLSCSVNLVCDWGDGAGGPCLVWPRLCRSLRENASGSGPSAEWGGGRGLDLGVILVLGARSHLGACARGSAACVCNLLIVRWPPSGVLGKTACQKVRGRPVGQMPPVAVKAACPRTRRPSRCVAAIRSAGDARDAVWSLLRGRMTVPRRAPARDTGFAELSLSALPDRRGPLLIGSIVWAPPPGPRGPPSNGRTGAHPPVAASPAARGSPTPSRTCTSPPTRRELLLFGRLSGLLTPLLANVSPGWAVRDDNRRYLEAVAGAAAVSASRLIWHISDPTGRRTKPDPWPLRNSFLAWCCRRGHLGEYVFAGRRRLVAFVVQTVARPSLRRTQQASTRA